MRNIYIRLSDHRYQVALTTAAWNCHVFEYFENHTFLTTILCVARSLYWQLFWLWNSADRVKNSHRNSEVLAFQENNDYWFLFELIFHLKWIYAAMHYNFFYFNCFPHLQWQQEKAVRNQILWWWEGQTWSFVVFLKEKIKDLSLLTVLIENRLDTC